MSNRSGSLMLNKILRLSKKYNFFENLDKDGLVNFIKEFLLIGFHYDCTEGEVLMGFAKEFDLCYYCLAFSDGLNEKELCKKCA